MEKPKLPSFMPKVNAVPPITHSSNGTQQDELLISTLSRPSDGSMLETPSALPKNKGTSAATPGKNSASSDEKAADVSDNGNKKQKAKKRKKAPRDSTAPRQPLTGYVRFLNDRRDKVRADNPTLPFFELTKLMAVEWSQLPQEQKKQYLEAADLDRDRYAQELTAYKQTEAYKIFTDKQKEKKLCLEKPELKLPAPDDARTAERDPFFSAVEIPIFTEEFLDHNKSRENELRQLRKSNIDFEQQNAILEKHIEGMKTAVEKLEMETNQARANNSALMEHLDQMRTTLAANLSSVHIPGYHASPTKDNIDAFMTRLGQLLQDPATANREALANKIRDMIGRLEFCG